jgi:putative transposase
MIEVNGEQDHIHLLFQYYPQLELPKFVGNVKSITSRRLRAEFPELAERFKKSVLWNESYLIASCGGVTVSQLKNYVEKRCDPSAIVSRIEV